MGNVECVFISEGEKHAHFLKKVRLLSYLFILLSLKLVIEKTFGINKFTTGLFHTQPATG